MTGSLTDTERRLGGWSGILGPVAYVASWAILGAVREGYDPVSQAISELGEVGATTRPVMTAAFVLFGLTAIPFARAVGASLPVHAPIVPVVIVVCGLATVGGGLFSCTKGCPGPGFASSPTDNGHAVMAVVGYLALVAAPLSTAWVLRSTSGGWHRIAAWSLAAGMVSAVLMLFWALEVFGSVGGLAQRVFNTVADVWWAAAGVVVVRHHPLPTSPMDEQGRKVS